MEICSCSLAFLRTDYFEHDEIENELGLTRSRTVFHIAGLEAKIYKKRIPEILFYCVL